jgi:transcriptional regulator with XRE-family HTH domain
MSRFEVILREARHRAGFTQKELAQKVDISDSYISKLETGVLPPPTRDVVLKLASVLGMDEDFKRDFLLAANAYGAEDLQGFTLVKAGADQAAGQGQQASGEALESIATAAMPIRGAVFDTMGQEVDSLAAPSRLSDEEYAMVASVIVETTKRLLSFIETQRKMRKDN